MFVYGTLRSGAGNEMHHLLKRYAGLIGHASYQGRLFTIDYYPGVVPSTNPAHQVKGEVYSLREFSGIITKLDDYEECGPGFTKPTEYVRIKQDVVLANGRKLIAWVYVYNHPTEGFQEIASGDFLSFCAEKDKNP